MSRNATATNSTAVGYNAGRYNLTGTGLTAFGSQALASNSSGTSNTAVGYQSLNVITNGTSNTAVGYQTSAGAFGNGQYNTVLGAYAQASGGTNNYSTIVGYAASGNSSTVSLGVAAGSNLGLSYGGGSNNLWLGNLTGSSLGAGAGQFNTVASACAVSGSPGKLDNITSGHSNAFFGHHNHATSTSNCNGIGIGDSLEVPNNGVIIGYPKGFRGIGDTTIAFNQSWHTIPFVDTSNIAGVQSGNDTSVVNTKWFVTAQYQVNIYLLVKTNTGTINATINFYAEDGSYQSWTPPAFTNITTTGVFAMSYPLTINPLRASVSITTTGTVSYYPTASFIKIK